MLLPEISELFDAHWKPGWGTVAPDELDYIQSLIRQHRPTHFLEIGMASGMSTGFIARFLEANGGQTLTSVDHDDTFFGDTSKPNGFLVPTLYKGTGVEVRLEKFKTALDVGGFRRTWEMAFIDANHQHPWPMLDTLAVAPYLTGAKVLIHHDLDLFMKQKQTIGIGPKYLFDQFPESHREASDANSGNIFSVSLDMPKEQLEGLAIKALQLPWSLRVTLQPRYIQQVRHMLATHYSPRLCNHFDHVLKNQNRPEPQRGGRRHWLRTAMPAAVRRLVSR